MLMTSCAVTHYYRITTVCVRARNEDFLRYVWHVLRSRFTHAGALVLCELAQGSTVVHACISALHAWCFIVDRFFSWDFLNYTATYFRVARAKQASSANAACLQNELYCADNLTRDRLVTLG
jgi:hypothetical protein